MNKDLLDDKYGRFYELSKELVKLGHNITGVCFSYRKRNEGHVAGPKVDGTLVDWYSINLQTSFLFGGVKKYIKLQNEMIRQSKPDVIIGCSDTIHIIIASYFAKKFDIPFIADLYDNFESYGLTKIPSVKYFFKKAVKRADIVTCISENLKNYLMKTYNLKNGVSVLPNGVPAGMFIPMDKVCCRKKLGLDIHAKLIGTAGALGPSRGTGLLVDAVKELHERDESIRLILAGPREKDMLLPSNSFVHYLGMLEYEMVPFLFNALDVGVICNVDSDFAKYCFPQKAYEMLACDLPVTVAKIGDISNILQDKPQSLYDVGEGSSLKQSIYQQLCSADVYNVQIPTWQNLAQDLENVVASLNS